MSVDARTVNRVVDQLRALEDHERAEVLEGLLAIWCPTCGRQRRELGARCHELFPHVHQAGGAS